MPKTKITKANRINRRLDRKIGVKKNNKNQILIKKEQIHNLAKVVIERPKVDIIEKIIVREKNKEIIKVIEKIKKVKIKLLKGDK